jgi:hypothetical protein
MSPVIDRAFFQLDSNAPDVEKGFAGLIKTLAGTNEAVKKSQEKVKDLANENARLQDSIKRLEEEHGKLSAFMASGTQDIRKWGEANQRVVEINKELTDLEKKAGKSKDDLGAAQKRLSVETDKSGTSFQAFGQIVSNFVQHPLDTARTAIGGILETMGPTAVGIGALGAAAAVAGAAIFEMARGAAENAIQLRNQGMISGLSAQQMQALTRIEKEAGLEGSNLTQALGMLNKELAGGMKGGMGATEIVKVLNALRLSSGETAADLTRGIIPLLDDLQAHLAKVEDKTERAGLANEAFGRRFQFMIPLLEGSNKPLSEQIETMVKAGQTWDDAAQGKLVRLHESINLVTRGWNEMKLAVESAAGTLASAAIRFWPGQTSEGDAKVVEEGIAKKGMEGKGMNFPASPFSAVNMDMKQGAMESVNQRIAIAKEVAKGDLEYLDVKTKIADLENKMRMAESQGNADLVEELAWQLNGENRKLEAMKEEAKLWPKLLEERKKVYNLERDIRLTQEAIDVKGAAALVPGKTTVAEGERKAAEDVKQWLAEAARAQSMMAKDATAARLDELRDEQKIVGTIIPMHASERLLIEQKKVALTFEIQAEEIKVRYAQKRRDLEAAIAAEKNPTIRENLRSGVGVLDEQMQKELDVNDRLRGATMAKTVKENALRVMDSVRSAADGVWDAITSRGKGAFQSLADWAEGLFLTLGKRIFENLAVSIFSNSPLAGLFGGSGGLGALGSFGTPGFAPGGGAGSGSLWSGIKSVFGGGAGAASSVASPYVGTVSGWADSAGNITRTAPAAPGKLASGLASAGIMGGTMLVSDAYRRGSVVEGAAGGAAAGAGMGFMIGAAFGPGGMAIGAIVGALAGTVAGAMAGVFGGGEAARERERGRRAGIQAGYTHDALTGESVTMGFGASGNIDAETDLRGRVIGRGAPAPIVGTVVLNLIDGSQADQAADRFLQTLARKAISGSSQLGDNLAFLAGQ